MIWGKAAGHPNETHLPMSIIRAVVFITGKMLTQFQSVTQQIFCFLSKRNRKSFTSINLVIAHYELLDRETHPKICESWKGKYSWQFHIFYFFIFFTIPLCKSERLLETTFSLKKEKMQLLSLADGRYQGSSLNHGKGMVLLQGVT